MAKLDLVEQVHDLLASSPYRDATDQVTSLLRLTVRSGTDTRDVVVERVRGALLALGYSDEDSGQVVSFLRLVDDRDRHISALAGGPKLMESESLLQTYAGTFHRDAFATVRMIDANALVAVLEPLGVQDTRGFAKRLRDSSELIGLKHGRAYVYPEFQFDPAKHKVREVVAEANRLLLAARDPWGALAWWTSPNPRWDRQRPIDHPDDERVVALAEAETDDGF